MFFFIVGTIFSQLKPIMISNLSYYLFLSILVVYYYKFLCVESPWPKRRPSRSVGQLISEHSELVCLLVSCTQLHSTQNLTAALNNPIEPCTSVHHCCALNCTTAFHCTVHVMCTVLYNFSALHCNTTVHCTAQLLSNALHSCCTQHCTLCTICRCYPSRQSTVPPMSTLKCTTPQNTALQRITLH